MPDAFMLLVFQMQYVNMKDKKSQEGKALQDKMQTMEQKVPSSPFSLQLLSPCMIVYLTARKSQGSFV